MKKTDIYPRVKGPGYIYRIGCMLILALIVIVFIYPDEYLFGSTHFIEVSFGLIGLWLLIEEK